MSRWLRVLFGGVPLSETDAAVVRATFADWRHEVAGASRLRALLTSLRYTVALTRVTTGLAFRDLGPALRSPFLRRSAFGLVALVYFGTLLEVDHAVLGRLGHARASVLAFAESMPWVWFVVPLLAFLVEALGDRRRVGPSLGSVLLLGTCVAAGLTFGTGPSLEYAWSVRSNLGQYVPPGSPPGLFQTAYVGLLFAAMTMTAPIAAYRARQYGQRSGWLIALAPYLGVLVFLAVLVLLVSILPSLFATLVRSGAIQLVLPMVFSVLVVGPLVAAAWLTRRMKVVA